MIDKICELLTIRIQKQMPEIDEEKAEVIKYGLELIIGEIPKILLLFIVAAVLKIGWLVIFAYITMLPYKIVAGGFHLKTNIGCTIGTFVVYFGNVLLSKYIVIGPIEVKIAILRKKERKLKKILSFVFASVTLILSLIIKNTTLSNILLFNVIIETTCITRIAYIITKNEYGYENYLKTANTN